jgi:hypothetical protein
MENLSRSGIHGVLYSRSRNLKYSIHEYTIYRLIDIQTILTADV